MTHSGKHRERKEAANSRGFTVSQSDVQFSQVKLNQIKDAPF
jgi:hypothetical protein